MTTPHDDKERGARSADDLGFELPRPTKLGATRLVALGACGLAVVAAAFAMGFWPRHSAKAGLERDTREAAGAVAKVVVVAPKVAASDRALALPGTIQPMEETTVYPRVDGYVRSWSVDIGDVVKEGQVLAEIDTPEIDQQLAQARAQAAEGAASVLQAKANRDVSTASLTRTEKLVAEGVASQQELDERRGKARSDEAAITVAEATHAAQQANIRRFGELKTFAAVVAPFAGRVTRRTIQRGMLVSAGTATPLFQIASTDPVRILLGVPQDVAPSVKPDVAAKVTVREFAGQTFEGRVARSAGALDAATRTMNTEIRVPNPDGKLLAGMFAQVLITLPSPHRVLELPATVLFNDAQGLRVAVVTPDDMIHLAPIVIERDTGATLLVASGLDGSERIVKNASAALAEGTKVEIVPDVAAPSASASPAASPPASARPAASVR